MRFFLVLLVFCMFSCSAFGKVPSFNSGNVVGHVVGYVVGYVVAYGHNILGCCAVILVHCVVS